MKPFLVSLVLLKLILLMNIFVYTTLFIFFKKKTLIKLVLIPPLDVNSVFDM